MLCPKPCDALILKLPLTPFIYGWLWPALNVTVVCFFRRSQRGRRRQCWHDFGAAIDCERIDKPGGRTVRGKSVRDWRILIVVEDWPRLAAGAAWGATITVKARRREDIGYGQTQIIARLGR